MPLFETGAKNTLILELLDGLHIVTWSRVSLPLKSNTLATVSFELALQAPVTPKLSC